MKVGNVLLLFLGSLQEVFTQVPLTAFTEITTVEEDLGSGLLEGVKADTRSSRETTVVCPCQPSLTAVRDLVT